LPKSYRSLRHKSQDIVHKIRYFAINRAVFVLGGNTAYNEFPLLAAKPCLKGFAQVNPMGFGKLVYSRGGVCIQLEKQEVTAFERACKRVTLKGSIYLSVKLGIIENDWIKQVDVLFFPKPSQETDSYGTSELI
jgi:hypothetical protein